VICSAVIAWEIDDPTMGFSTRPEGRRASPIEVEPLADVEPDEPLREIKEVHA
jgi:hypothetical protein